MKILHLNRFIKSTGLMIILFTIGLNSYAQLSDLHYLPPLKQEAVALDSQALYLSTPETNSFIVNVYRGNSNVVLTTLTISKSSSATYNLPNANNDITLVSDSNTGTVLSNSGLKLIAPGGQKFYLNYRGKSGSQASSLTSKGRAAFGTAFKWGGVPNKGSNTSILSSCIGFMATQDNTTISIFGYDPSCTFRSPTSINGITADNLSITLNAGQSYVLEAPLLNNTANVDGWLGASIKSDKDIVVSIGEMHFQPRAGDGSQDCGIDQIIPENTLGREYVFVRGNGVDALEFPVIVATRNNTEIYVNGASTPIATINNGDYFSIPSTYYSSSSTTTSVSGANMYVYTSKEAYAFQALSGSSSTATSDINFIAPVNCLLSNSVDYIPNITDMAGTTINGGVTIIASTAIADEDIIVTYGANQVSTVDLVAGKTTLVGNPNWKTFYVSGLTGDVSVSANGPIAVGFFGFSGVAGSSGYFSGFESIPTIQVTVDGDGCLPGTILTATPGFTTYRWYNGGTLISGVTSNTYTPTFAGDFTVIVSNGSCTYESAVQNVYDCNPELVLSVTADNTFVESGSNVVFTVRAKYLGYDEVSNVIITNSLPSVVSYSNASASYGAWNSIDTWTIGTMYPGEEHILTVTCAVNTVSIPTNGTYTISSTQTFSGTEGNDVPDDLTETITAVVLLVEPTLSDFIIPEKTTVVGSFIIGPPTSNSTGDFSYTSSNTTVATISGTTVTILNEGTTTITANQAADASYTSGSIAAVLTVSSISVITKHGAITETDFNYVNKNGKTGSSSGLNKNGALIYTKNIMSIGDSYNGGIVGYILQPGDPGYDSDVQHGIIVAPADQSNGKNNGTYGQNIQYVTPVDIGTGQNNTALVALNVTQGGLFICANLNLNLYSDWFLPSRNELLMIYENRVIIGGFTTSGNELYWTSSFNPANANFAYHVNFTTGIASNSIRTNNTSLSVRAIRYF